MFLSPASRQSLLGLRVLASNGGSERFHLAGDVARKAGLPANALGKIFQRLARRGLLLSQRGPGGGYALSKRPAEVPLASILRLVQDILPGGHHCLLRNKLRLDSKFCLIHQVIVKADRLLVEGFEGLTLEDLAKSGGWA